MMIIYFHLKKKCKSVKFNYLGHRWPSPFKLDENHVIEGKRGWGTREGLGSLTISQDNNVAPRVNWIIN